MLNDQGESPRHITANRRSGSSTSAVLYALHAVGAKRCSQKDSKCTDGCSPTGKDDGQSSTGDLIPRSRHLFDSMLEQVGHHSATASQGSYVELFKPKVAYHFTPTLELQENDQRRENFVFRRWRNPWFSAHTNVGSA